MKMNDFDKGFDNLDQFGSIQSPDRTILWPNLKNLSGGLNLSRGLNMIGST